MLQESFAMTDKSYPPPYRNYLQSLYLFVTLYACAQRVYSSPDEPGNPLRIFHKQE